MRVFLYETFKDGGHIVGQDAGAKPCRGVARYTSIGEKLDLFRAAEIEIVADHLLEEQAAMQPAGRALRCSEAKPR
jgi:hypothetical protein